MLHSLENNSYSIALLDIRVSRQILYCIETQLDFNDNPEYNRYTTRLVFIFGKHILFTAILIMLRIMDAFHIYPLQ